MLGDLVFDHDVVQWDLTEVLHHVDDGIGILGRIGNLEPSLARSRLLMEAGIDELDFVESDNDPLSVAVDGPRVARPQLLLKDAELRCFINDGIFGWFYPLGGFLEGGVICLKRDFEVLSGNLEILRWFEDGELAPIEFLLPP